MRIAALAPLLLVAVAAAGCGGVAGRAAGPAGPADPEDGAGSAEPGDGGAAAGSADGCATLTSPRFRAHATTREDGATAIRLVSVAGPAGGSQLGLRVEQPDLNCDGLLDEMIWFADDCGTWGDCPVGLYVACGDGTVAEVFPPDDVWQLEVHRTATEVDGVAWRNLVEHQRSGGEDEASSRAMWRFDGTAYRQDVASVTLVHGPRPR